MIRKIVTVKQMVYSAVYSVHCTVYSVHCPIQCLQGVWKFAPPGRRMKLSLSTSPSASSSSSTSSSEPSAPNAFSSSFSSWRRWVRGAGRESVHKSSLPDCWLHDPSSALFVHLVRTQLDRSQIFQVDPIILMTVLVLSLPRFLILVNLPDILVYVGVLSRTSSIRLAQVDHGTHPGIVVNQFSRSISSSTKPNQSTHSIVVEDLSV